MDARQGSAILRVVSMVTVFGILGNGLFGAGMRAVSGPRGKRAAALQGGADHAAAAAARVGHHRHAALSARARCCCWRSRISSTACRCRRICVSLCRLRLRCLRRVPRARPDHRRGRQHHPAKQSAHPAHLHGHAVSRRRDVPDLVPAGVAASRDTVRARDLRDQWRRRHSAAGRIDRCKICTRSRALLLTAAVALFIATKLFRWEKEEKLRPSAKLWVLVVLLPFLLLGAYQAWSRQDLAKAKILERDLRRGRSWLIQDARIFVGDGQGDRVAARCSCARERSKRSTKAQRPDAKSLNAEPIEAAGKTVLPGLIDVHAHLGSTGGFYEDWSKFDSKKAIEQRAEGLPLLRRHGGAQRRRSRSICSWKLRQPFATRRKARRGAAALRADLHDGRRPRDAVRQVHAGADARLHSPSNSSAPRSRPRKRGSRSTSWRRKASTRSRACSNRAPPGCRSTAWTSTSCAAVDGGGAREEAADGDSHRQQPGCRGCGRARSRLDRARLVRR